MSRSGGDLGVPNAVNDRGGVSNADHRILHLNPLRPYFGKRPSEQRLTLARENPSDGRDIQIVIGLLIVFEHTSNCALFRSNSLHRGALLRRSLIGGSLRGCPLVGGPLFCRALVSCALVGGALLARPLIGGSPLGRLLFRRLLFRRLLRRRLLLGRLQRRRLLLRRLLCRRTLSRRLLFRCLQSDCAWINSWRLRRRQRGTGLSGSGLLGTRPSSVLLLFNGPLDARPVIGERYRGRHRSAVNEHLPYGGDCEKSDYSKPHQGE